MKFSLDRVRVERKAIPDNAVTYEIPHMPPSTNNLYFNAPGRGRVKTRQYEDWLQTMGLLLRRQGLGRITGRVDVVISLEDKHARRDASNCIKPVEDLLVKMGILQDDSSKYVRSVKAVWAPIAGVKIDIRPFSFSETRGMA